MKKFVFLELRKSILIFGMIKPGTQFSLLLYQNFKSYIVAFLTLFHFKSLNGVLAFFLMNKNSILGVKKHLLDWPLQQSPEAKLLIAMVSVRC